MGADFTSANVSILVTTYNPRVGELEENLKSYLNQAQCIILTDNSDDVVRQREVFALAAMYPTIVVKQLSRNLGIAAAQNIGLQEARARRSEFVIEMDQDSKLPPDYVSNLMRRFRELTDKGIKVGGIGPLAVRKDSDEVYDGLTRSGDVIEVEYTLSSGFLMRFDAIDAVGQKNEDLFIDFVDWEWCWRSRERGYRIFIDTTLEISHMLGDGHKKILGQSIGMPSPIRHYYQFRNFIYLLGKSFVPGKWKLKYSVIMLAKLCLIPLCFDRKMKRLSFAITGIKDAIRGAWGKIGE
ncbi:MULTISPECIES: glycosyltransferase family 2 protein [unclassified Pseudomonas]|uniref:glycosyltransferase family 2 protein n=1 Tax=unclassified Pseudomonas TaxID=196821 RepID=UPI00048193D6|nr:MULTISPECIES: glycosyltransferase family 2 protein [unclassified Pseudomonas]RAS26165.1 rhamnosyltransferase [Pseudomonas sp. URMO17WK12:I7]SMF42126.1 rhamnosyltransferase [Pseudomonas sp. URMO17WK12:I5]